MLAGVSATPGSLLECASRAARQAGVTRLARLTDLDRIGLPVWQAVRPMSRALSVHQGKYLTDEEAQIGALLEAVESDFAERFDAGGPVCPWTDLPARNRVEDLSDLADDRGHPPPREASVRWVAARDMIGDLLYLPLELVSLDLTRDHASRYDRSSNGVATGVSHCDALLRALCELIERDAVTEWRSQGPLACLHDRIEIRTIPFEWFGSLAARLRSLGIYLSCYRVPSLCNVPCFLCEIADRGKASAIYGAVWGSGAHADPETALLRAVAEAAQSRATLIAGTREDFPPSAYSERGSAAIAFAFPAPPGWRGLDWRGVAPGPPSLDALAGRLANAGFGRIGWVELGAAEGFDTVRAFVPGLAGLRRRRRVVR